MQVKGQGFFKKTEPELTFPRYMVMSQNHYKPSWGTKHYRRLKNIVVYMEWVPNLREVQEHQEVRRSPR